MSIGSQVSTKDIAHTVFNDDSREIRTDSTDYDYLRRARGTITYPDSFANRAWSIGSGTGGPNGGDRRIENPTSTISTTGDQIITEVGSDGWPEWKAIAQYNANQSGWSSGAINSFVNTLRAGEVHRLTGTRKLVRVDINSNNTVPSFSVTVWGYSNGYLAGSRVQYGRHEVKSSVNNAISFTFDFTPTSAHPWLVVNVEALASGSDNGYAGMCTGTVYGMEMVVL